MVRIFILAGDDNIEGYASVPHLHKLATNSDTRKQYKHWLEKDGKRWKVRDDVFVTYDHKRDKELSHGPLTVTGFGANPNTFGPEVEIGRVLGDIFAEPVILVKAGWSHRSLEKDFQAPSDSHPGGFQWFRLMASVTETVERMDEIVGPDYKHARHQISGLLWWHGYSDMALNGAVKTYPDHLKHWFHTIRSKIQLFLPIVVAEMGGQGTKDVTPEELSFREMQKNIVSDPELKRNTILVPTASLVKRNADETPGANERDTYEHYYGRADTMIDIGKALGIALAEQTKDGAKKLHSKSSRSGIEMTPDVRVFILALFGMSVGGILLITVFRKSLFSRSERKAIEDFIMSPLRSRQEYQYDVAFNGEIEASSYHD